MIRVCVLARGLARAGIESLLEGNVQLVMDPVEAEVLVAHVESGETLPPRWIGEQMPPLIVLADQPRREWLFGDQPVRGLLPQSVQASELAAAVQAVQAGLTVVHPVSLRDAEGEDSTEIPVAVENLLTPREIEVLRRVAEGLPNKIIAHEMSISEHTVKFHVAQILSKLQAGSRTEAVTAGLRLGIVHL